MKVYVVVQDVGLNLGDGYSSYASKEFICIETTFEKARNKIKELAEKDGYGTDEITIYDEDWDFISLGLNDIYDTNVCYQFIPFEIEAG